MKINYTPEQLKRAQRNGAAKRNGPASLACPQCGGHSLVPRIRQPQFLACNNCKAICTITEATQRAQRRRVLTPAPVVLAPKGTLPQRYEYEWRPLKRNAHEHAELAMLERRG